MSGELGLGATFAGYQIDGLIGQGGMGVVYRANQLALGRTVALKVLSPGLAGSEDFRLRFQREARIAASIEDPNVVALYEAGEAEGRLFLAMQLVEGSDLREIITRDGVMDPLRAAHIVSQVGNALEAAHSRGLVHRDVKPGNILIAQRAGRDHAYLTDFGLTREASSTSGLTRTGVFVGTLDYVAPEQVKGEEIDARTDVYALGCVLFEALTGHVPYPRNDDISKIWAHVNEPPPEPTQLVGTLSRDFDLVVSHSMAKDPSKRVASAAALGGAALAAAEGNHERVIQMLASAPLPRASPDPPRATAPPAGMPAAPLALASVLAEAPAPQTEPPRSRTGRRRRLHRVRARSAGARSSVANVRHTAADAVCIPLAPGFEYLHGRLDENGLIPLLGNEQLVEALWDHLAHSQDGAFLLTGFRGVGKTTVVERALSRLARDGDDGRLVLHVRVDIAMPKTPQDVLFEILRGLHDSIHDQRREGRLGGLDEEVAQRLLLAYRRTSAEVSASRELMLDRTTGGGVGVPAGPLTLNAERSVRSSLQSRGEERFGAYTVRDAEADFRWLAAHLYGYTSRAGGSRSRRWMWWRRSPAGEARAVKGALVVVFDEIDKLTDQPGGEGQIRSLVTGLKSLLTTRDAHYVFVAGPDMHDTVAADRDRGNSVFGVFGWQEYVPCLWGVEDRLLDAVITDPAARASDEVDLLRRHLAFCGRGLPREMLRVLNSFVRSEGGSHHLEFTPEDIEHLRLFAGFERCVREFVESHEGAERRELEIDKWRLGVYYAVEAILDFRVAFSLAQVMKLGAGDGIDTLFALSRDEVVDLLEHLEENEFLRRAGGPAAAQRVFEDVPEEELTNYEVIPDVEAALRDYSRRHDAEEPLLSAAADDAVLAGYVGQSLADGRYTLLEELDRTGIGRVHRARDRDSEDEVALKVFEGLAGPGDTEMRERFEREGRIALALRHPHIVATRATFGEPDGRLAIVMDLVSGVSIGHRLSTQGPWSSREVVTIASQILEALGYLEQQGVARLDLRPSGIMVDDALSPVIVNLGLAKNVRAAGELGPTRVGAVVGTPRYASPEQLSGAAVDIRADLYSLGLILFEMLVGHPAREGDSVAAVIGAALKESIDMSEVHGSATLRVVLHKALARDPEARYPSPAAMRDALLAAPEAQREPAIR